LVEIVKYSVANRTATPPQFQKTILEIY